MLVAIAVCAASAVASRSRPGARRTVGLDAPALQHLAQIPGVLLLAWAVAGNAARVRPRSRRPVPRPDRAGPCLDTDGGACAISPATPEGAHLRLTPARAGTPGQERMPPEAVP